MVIKVVSHPSVFRPQFQKLESTKTRHVPNWSNTAPTPLAEFNGEQVKIIFFFRIFLFWEDVRKFYGPFALILEDENHILCKIQHAQFKGNVHLTEWNQLWPPIIT